MGSSAHCSQLGVGAGGPGWTGLRKVNTCSTGALPARSRGPDDSVPAPAGTLSFVATICIYCSHILGPMEAREGLAQAIRRVGARVYGVANGDTEDVVQEALARAIKSGVSLEAEQWLTTVAKRVAIDQHRRRHDIPSGAPVELEKWTPSAEGNPEDTFIRAERAEAVREAMAALPPRYRKALEAFAEEDSPAAVSKRLGLSATATWTLLSRARSRLKLQLESVGFVPALVSVTRGRWRGLIAAGAAAGVAATAALGPISPPKTTIEKPAPKILSLAAPTKVKPQAEPKAQLPKLPVDADAVTKTVDDAVAKVKDAPASIKVTTCLSAVSALLPKADVSLEIKEMDAQRRDLTELLIKTLPEPLRQIGPDTCV
jgi:RNA polymerase sigma factor (sigma-70 family)